VLTYTRKLVRGPGEACNARGCCSWRPGAAGSPVLVQAPGVRCRCCRKRTNRRRVVSGGRISEDDNREETEEITALRDFVETVHTLTVEVGSAHLWFADSSKADEFRELSIESKSVVCAAVFAAVRPPELRKGFAVPVVTFGDLHWRELPPLSLVEVPKVAPSEQFASKTVRLPKTMANFRLRATARSLASHLHLLQRRAECVADSWILYISGTLLDPTKKLIKAKGLPESLEKEGWTKEKGCFSLQVPCFVLVCPASLVDSFGVVLEQMLTSWKLLPTAGCIMLRALSWEVRSGHSLLSLAPLAGDVATAHELNLRGSGISERSALPEVQELVAAMPKVKHIDFAYNGVGGVVFCDWLWEWLRGDSSRTVDMSGTALLAHVRERADKRGLGDRIVSSD
jgi:hypothetical protein